MKKFGVTQYKVLGNLWKVLLRVKICGEARFIGGDYTHRGYFRENINDSKVDSINSWKAWSRLEAQKNDQRVEIEMKSRNGISLFSNWVFMSLLDKMTLHVWNFFSHSINHHPSQFILRHMIKYLDYQNLLQYAWGCKCVHSSYEVHTRGWNLKKWYGIVGDCSVAWNDKRPANPINPFWPQRAAWGSSVMFVSYK